jgi:SNARE protein 1
MSTKLEINIRSLIAQCEQIIEINKEDWRLKKFIRSLEIMIDELQEQKWV